MRPLLVGCVAAALVLNACSSDADNSLDSRPNPPVPTSPAPTRSSTTRAPARTTTTRPSTNLANARIALAPVASGLDSPVAIAFRRGNTKMYVAEQPGRIRVVENGQVREEPVLSLNVSGGNEQGLLGLDFSRDGTLLYVNYTDTNGDTNVVEYTMNGDIADPGSARELVFQEQPFANHNGGQVLVGPDNMLYIPLGDGGSGGDPNNNAQNLGTFLGKVLRVNPRENGDAPYSIPSDNPLVDQSGARGEIWMYGLRNPWRMSFDRETEDAWIGDVGQGAFEEIDYAPAGESGTNWGWSAREGAHPYESRFGTRTAPGAKDPIIETGRSNGECAIVGGYVYRGTAIPALRGIYLYGDNCARPVIGALTFGDGLLEQRQLADVQSLTTFGEDNDGELYAASRSGTIYRFDQG